MDSSFKKNKYMVLKKVINPELAKFVTDYFLLKRKVAQTFYREKWISPFSTEWGVWNDQQAPDTYSHYADIAMETLLQWVLPTMEKHTKLKLVPTYSYARIYKNGDVLKKHKDRYSCEISTTVNLGGDPWPIYLNNGKKNIKVNLNPGDMLIYRGIELEHWREKFKGEYCAQVFLHYNVKNKKANLFDDRLHLGLPAWFKGRK
jgi:hypothetical protein